MIGISKASTLNRITEHKQMIGTAFREIVYSCEQQSPYYERSTFVYMARALKNMIEIPSRSIGIGLNKIQLAIINKVGNVAEKKRLNKLA